MLSIQSNNINPMTFKANNVPPKQSADIGTAGSDKEPYKTHAGLKTGIGYATLNTLCSLPARKNNPKFLSSILTTYGVSMAAGAIVDKVINDKRSEFSEDNAGKTNKEILKENDDAELTRTGEVYQKLGAGKKYGALVGAIALPVLNFVNFSQLRKLPFIISGVVSGALGGLMLGAITDHFSNNGAKKHAE